MRHLLPLACLLAAACTAVPDSGSPATPQRPTLSSDTSTTASDTYEVELGGQWNPNRQLDTPLSLKFGAGPRTEVFVGLSPLLLIRSSGGDSLGPSDLVVGLRHRLRDQGATAPSGAIQASLKLPTANENNGLGSGELDASFAGILSDSVGAASVTAYYSLDLLGDPTGGTDVGHSLAFAASTPLTGEVSGFAEIAGVFVPEQDVDQAFATLGASLSPYPSLVYDLAAVLGLNDEADSFRLLFGLTRNLGR